MENLTTLDAKALFHRSYDELVANHKKKFNEKSTSPLGILRIDGNRCAWILLELEPETNIAFGLCDLGLGFPELGYVDINEVYDAVSDSDLLRYYPFKKLNHTHTEYVELANSKECISTFTDDALIDIYDNDDIIDEIFNETLIDEEPTLGEEVIPLNDFLTDYREDLLAQIDEQIPPVFSKIENQSWEAVLNSLYRQPISKQRDKIHAVCTGLIDRNLEAVILNGEMGSGKTFMSIAISAVYHQHNNKPALVMCPPHLVYKWRREILDTVPNAKVTVVNGSDAINKLLKLREDVLSGNLDKAVPQYVIIGRVRMRMGFHWKLAYNTCNQVLKVYDHKGDATIQIERMVTCSQCGKKHVNSDGEPYKVSKFIEEFVDKRVSCKHCGSPFWTMHHRDEGKKTDKAALLLKFLCRLPGIGKVTANKLILKFGEDMLTTIIDDNIYDFVNLMDEEGEYVFDEKKSQCIERSLGRLEFALRFISYQPSEFVKRYLPRKFFGLAIADEAHEYKNSGSAQGQAMGVLASCADKTLGLTGTLMGGYASDLFHLLFRAMPSSMVNQNYRANEFNSLATAEMNFMRQFGCLIDVIKTTSGNSHRTARGSNSTVSVKKAPGFSPVGISKFVLPYTVFMRLSDLGGDCLPEYTEHTHLFTQDEEVQSYYSAAESRLVAEMKTALRQGDKSLLGLVMNFLLRWPDTVANAETLTHPNTRETLFNVPSFGDDIRPKEQHMIDLCVEQCAKNRRVLVYTTYTGKHDTATRLKTLLCDAGLKAAVLRSSVATDEREDWIANKVEQGIEVLICNPELVKTGLDLLAFPTIYFMQTGFNTYTVEQAARRSWRIGQQHAVEVHYAGYEKTQQIACLELMAAKIKVNQSTSGVMPDSGLDIFEDEGEASLMTEMAKSLLAKN